MHNCICPEIQHVVDIVFIHKITLPDCFKKMTALGNLICHLYNYDN